MDEERRKKPLAIGRFDARRINRSTVTVHFYFSWIAGICHTCNDLFIIMYL